MNDQILLLHGLWMRGFILATLRRRLERANFRVISFDYPSVLGDGSACVKKLVARARSLDASAHGKLHFVGHSLGGLIALLALRETADFAPGRVVCLGSPLRGSAVARRVGRWPGGASLVGKNLDTLRNGMETWQGTRAVGVIAGNAPFGMGLVLGAPSLPHDGMVGVEETRLSGIADHCVVAATHTGLLFSAAAAQQTVAFLRHGQFERAT